MQLILTPQILEYAWGSSTEYWFSRIDYSIYKAYELPLEEYSQLVESGFIPFISISDEEVIHAYIKSLNNKKLSDVFENLSTNDCVETFWKYFNAYSDISAGFDAFESEYLISKVTSWCEENSVNYKIEK